MNSKQQTQYSIDWHSMSKSVHQIRYIIAGQLLKYDDIKYWFITKNANKLSAANLQRKNYLNAEKKLNPREKVSWIWWKKYGEFFFCCVDVRINRSWIVAKCMQ